MAEASPARLTARQGAVLETVERLGQPVMSELWRELPELVPSAIKQVLDVLERKGLVESGGAWDRVYVDGMRWRVPIRSEDELERQWSPMEPSEPPEGYYRAVRELEGRKPDPVADDDLRSPGSASWPALLSSRVGVVGSIMCELDAERRDGAPVPLEAEGRDGGSLRMALWEALLETGVAAVHVAAMSKANSEGASYSQAVRSVLDDAAAIGSGAASSADMSLDSAMRVLVEVVGDLASLIGNLERAERGDLHSRMQLEGRLGPGERLELPLTLTGIELASRVLSFMGLIDPPGSREDD